MVCNKASVPPAKSKGRPTKLENAAMRDRLIELIGKGVPNVHACAAVGISVPAFVQYRERHEWFRDELAAAVGSGVEIRLRKIEAAADAGEWRAAAWLLEHCQPEHFAKNRIEITGADGGPLTSAVAVYLPQKDGCANGKPRIVVADAVKEVGNGSEE
jgi:hypothetical protein